MSIRVFSGAFLDDLGARASSSERGRQHFNLHSNYSDRCQRFFNAIDPESYIRPHRHDESQGVETMIAIRGAMALLVFDDAGEIIQVQKFGVEPASASDDVAAVVEVGAGAWHTVISLEKGSVLLEVKAGPFNPDSPKCPASWAPDESSVQAAVYLDELRDFSVRLTI